ncbi:MAG: signal recognition particle-docking protein FtsY [bacterium]
MQKEISKLPQGLPPRLPPKPPSKLARWKQRLFKSRQLILCPLERLITGKESISQDLLNELEEILVRADLGVHISDRIVMDLKYTNFRQGENKVHKIKEVIEKRILGIIDGENASVSKTFPLVILMIGVNGSGKTSTVGKLASRFHKENKKVLVAACDTFRAAAAEQLEIWQVKAGVDIIKGRQGTDPSALVYDAGKLLLEKEYQVLIIDTAGRLHTKSNLMEELKKIKRTIDKVMPDIAQEILLVMDAACGQNGIQQAKLFKEAIGVTGIALTKLDGTAKGGIVVSIKENLGVPVKLIGLGEGIEDLEDFSSKDFVKALLEE